MDRVTVSPKRDRTNENFSKAASRLMRRCDQISRRYNARVYVQMSQQQQYYNYKSTNEESFPMPVDVLVRSWAPSIPSSTSPWIVANLAQDKLYPIPIRGTASDFGGVDPPTPPQKILGRHSGTRDR